MRNDDVGLLVEAIKQFPYVPGETDYAWWSAPLNVLDCVLSLNRHYDRFCRPRVQRFAERHPEVETLGDLRRLIRRYSSPLVFSVSELNYRDPGRAETLFRLVETLLRVQKQFSGATEETRLKKWAASAKPGDWKTLQVRGFGLSGFQYLRMLLGIQTAKPDVHIRSFVARVVRHPVSDVEALALLEDASRRARLPLRSLDYEIWKHSARKRQKGAA